MVFMIQRQPSGLYSVIGLNSFSQQHMGHSHDVMIVGVHVLHGWKYRNIINEYKYMPKIKAEYTNKTIKPGQKKLHRARIGLKSENNIQT